MPSWFIPQLSVWFWIKGLHQIVGCFLGIEESALLDSMPSWFTPHTWVECLILEQVHHAFHGLRRSIIAHSEQWQEYFQVDLYIHLDIRLT